MSTSERRLLFGVALLLFVFTFGYTIYQFGPIELGGKDKEAGSNTLLSEDAELVIHYLLGDGQIAKTELAPVATELVGKGIVDVRGIRPGWNIVSFSADRLVVNAFCSDSEYAGRFLRRAEGFVGIYEGDPDGCHRLVEMTDIRVDLLSEWAQTSLRDGIEYKHDEDLPQLLDGLKGSG